MRHFLALIALFGLVSLASAKVLVYQNVYKSTLEYEGSTAPEGQMWKIVESWNEVHVIEVDDETGEVLGGFAYAYVVSTEHGEKIKWAVPLEYDRDFFRVVPLSDKQALLILWGNEPNLAKLKDGIVTSSVGALTEVDEDDDYLYVYAGTSKLRLDSALTKKAQAAFDEDDSLEAVVPVIVEFLQKKGFELD
jgi:hypothetical protein